MQNAGSFRVLALGAVLVILTGCSLNQSVAVPVVTGVGPSNFLSSSLPRTVTVSGANFQSGLTVLLSTSGGTMQPVASQVTSTSFQISAVFPAGTCTITVSNPGGESSSPFNFSTKTATGISFAPRVDYPTGGTVTGVGEGSASIALADFNGDGKLDIAVSNYASNTISVFLNQGNGSFGSPVMTTVNPSGALGLGAIVAGDFNEDGKMDLIVGTIAGTQSDIVLLGKGDGTFTQADQIPNSFGFFQARAVDLNGDKHLDLVAGVNGNMAVALGKGDGTFNPVVWLPMGPLANSYLGIDVGDLTGNGKLDIVGADWTPNAGDIVTFLGNGDGTFQAPASQSPAPLVSDSVALADFNGDGKLDLLAGYSNGGAFGSPLASAQAAIGNGDGTFNLNAQVTVYSTFIGNNSIIVRAADLDQDGKPDALVADDGAGVLTVVLNNGTGVLNGSTYSYTIAPGICDLAAGDLNGDGMPDVVVVNNLTNQISVFLSQNQ